MLAARGVAQPDNLNPFVGVKHRILPPVAGDVCSGGPEELGCGLGTTSGEEQEWDEAVHGGSMGTVG